MNIMRNKDYWNLCIVGVLILCIVTFTPLVIPRGVYEPMLFGIPYTLWVGMIIAVSLVFLTYLATKVHPGNIKEVNDD
jgi:hypothetical protein